MLVRTIRTTIREGKPIPPGTVMELDDGEARALIRLKKCVPHDDPVDAPVGSDMNRAIGTDTSDNKPLKTRRK